MMSVLVYQSANPSSNAVLALSPLRRNLPHQQSLLASLAAPVAVPPAAPRTTGLFFTSLLAARQAVAQQVEARSMALTSLTVNAATSPLSSSVDLTTTVDQFNQLRLMIRSVRPVSSNHYDYEQTQTPPVAFESFTSTHGTLTVPHLSKTARR